MFPKCKLKFQKLTGIEFTILATMFKHLHPICNLTVCSSVCTIEVMLTNFTTDPVGPAGVHSESQLNNTCCTQLVISSLLASFLFSFRFGNYHCSQS
jgi:hypothetical protein